MVALSLLLPLFFLEMTYISDYAQIIIVFLTIFVMRQLNVSQKRKIADYFLFFSFAIVFFMLLQKIFPSLIDYTYNFLTIRQSSAEELINYTGGVIGIAPEPAYMGALLVGIWMYVIRFNELQEKKMTMVTLCGVFLTASLSASLMFLFLLLFRLNSIKFILHFTFVIFMFLILLFALHSSLLERIYNFFSIAVYSSPFVTLQNIDIHFGSYRLRTLYDPLTTLGCGVLFCSADYIRGYSIFAKLFYLVAPFHFLIFFLIFKWASGRDGLLSFIALITFGPVLNWMLYSGLINKDDNSDHRPFLSSLFRRYRKNILKGFL